MKIPRLVIALVMLMASSLVATASATTFLPVDPGAAGKYQVEISEYNLGDRVVDISAFKIKSELVGRVYTPVGATGRRPLVLFLHGIHETCYAKNVDPGDVLEWPCPKGTKPLPSYRGYDAPAKALASHGYQVVSISANAINLADFDTQLTGSLARAQLVIAHLKLWQRWSTHGDGPFGRKYVGKVDLQRVGLMGHSRGGEGVARAVQLNADLGEPFGIRAVLLLAPGGFLRPNLPGVALNVILPYCDGDVSDLIGQKYYDDSRYSMSGDPAARSVVLMMGANHNFFNTEWTPGRSVAQSKDDWTADDATCGKKAKSRLTAVEQEAAGRAYLAGFFRLELGGETALLPLLDGSNTRARSAGRAVTSVVAQSPDRYDVAHLDTLNGVLAGAARARICSQDCVRNGYGRLPHWTAMPPAESTPNLQVTELTWTGTSGRLRFDLGHHDVRRYSTLSLRAATERATELSVRLTDGRGHAASVPVSLRPLPGQVADLLPKVLLQTVRIPLAGLRIDLGDVRSVEFRTDQVTRGTAYLADLSFSKPALSHWRPRMLPVLSVADVDMAEGDAGPRSADFRVQLSRISPRPVTFWAESSGDTTAVTRPFRGLVTIPAGRRTATVRVPVSPNKRDGDDDEFILVLSKSTNAMIGRSLANGIVRDDDPTPVLTIGPGVGTEGRGGVVFPMKLSAPSDRVVTLTAELRSGTAKLGTDFLTPDGGLYPQLDEGRTTGQFVVPIKDDKLREKAETFTVVIAAADGAVLKVPYRVTGTIRDND
ncbi:Calx-beta domain-containing protein [Kribbella sp. NPDC051587]|uniref:Calx-beta domain-containing protein n=1 Tax=Kribbella sp. NPDC051587 TaxID=3364119 RepID=UPI00379744CC